MQCPHDQSVLVMSERKGIEIDYCPQCRGVWLDRGELDKIIERSLESEIAAEARGPVPPAPASPGPPYPASYDERRYDDKRYDDRRYDDKRYDDKRYDDKRYDDKRYDDRGYDPRYRKRKKKDSFLGDLFDF
ncbi:zf-TFIIB domain-containing protein [Isoptericola sp. NPDC056134]|uniref:TFIIB-type zinc ribbon-containing protein n=1 Tax=Isoptericola sp. NPDC056134 TaxID=3345723 RepID=UPI0035EE28D1